jgi:hypothetical protein
MLSFKLFSSLTSTYVPLKMFLFTLGIYNYSVIFSCPNNNYQFVRKTCYSINIDKLLKR